MASAVRPGCVARLSRLHCSHSFARSLALSEPSRRSLRWTISVKERDEFGARRNQLDPKAASFRPPHWCKIEG